jgi:hypothetical protein
MASIPRMATLSSGVRSDRQGASIEAPSQKQAAEMLNVGVASVKRAAAVVRGRAEPELARAVDQGKIAGNSPRGVARRD